jgi:hypothetical protein
VGWKHAHSSLGNGRYRTVTNACDQSSAAQIRLNVSPFGQRSPSSSSWYSRTVNPYVTCTVRGLLQRTTLRLQPRGDLAPLGEEL